MNAHQSADAYRIVDVNADNIDTEGLFCFQSKKNTEGYQRKLAWTKQRFKEGLHIKLLLVNEGQRKGFRKRGFIEYMPSKHAWRGIKAENYMIIHCMWIVGKNRGHGYGTKLLEKCVEDAKNANMNGIAVATSTKTWLPHAQLFIKHGFEKTDTYPPDFELYAKRFKENAPLPTFNKVSDKALSKHAEGITILVSDQCPYNTGNAAAVTRICKEQGITAKTEKVSNCVQAQNNIHPYGTFSILHNGKILSYHPIGRKELTENLTKKP
jgi:GNAT superfamily N-acetyltransferase